MPVEFVSEEVAGRLAPELGLAKKPSTGRCGDLAGVCLRKLSISYLNQYIVYAKHRKPYAYVFTSDSFIS